MPVYFAHAVGTELVKIGFTGGDPAERLRGLQTGCPHRLELIAVIPGGESDEGRWHEDYAADRVNGEWFRLTPRLTVAIAVHATWAAISPPVRAVPAAPQTVPPITRITANVKPELKVGIKVSHPEYGRGVIVGRDERWLNKDIGDNPRVKVRFDAAGEKTFLASKAPLSVIESGD